jgi:hypothetical protein
MHIHRDISIDIDKVIDTFAKNKNRKLEFVLLNVIIIHIYILYNILH